MGGDLKHRVAGGVAWSIAEKAGSMALQLVVSIVVARLLLPEDFGVMAIMTFFTSVALVVADSGFSQNLIRRTNPSDIDFGSVFIFNVVVSSILYVVLTAVSPFVADFYGLPAIARIAPVLFLVLPVNALCTVQNTLLVRDIGFGVLSRINFASSAVGGAVAVIIALAGGGVWSLVGQRMAVAAAKSAILWMRNPKPPVRGFSAGALREMAPFSLRLLATDLISSFYNNIAQMFIGKIYSADMLGYFNQAQKFKDLPVTSAQQSVQSVTYPAMSKICDDERKFAESFRQVLMTTAFMLFPMMAGMAAVADELFFVLLGAKWMPTVPYLQILCITGLFVPLTGVSLNVLKVKGDGRQILIVEIVKKLIMTAVLVVTVPRSVTAVAWGLAAVSVTDFVITAAVASSLSKLSPWRIVRCLLPTAFITAAMYAAVMFAGSMIDDLNAALRLAVKIVAGICAYLLLAFAFRLESAREVRSVAARLFDKR